MSSDTSYDKIITLYLVQKCIVNLTVQGLDLWWSSTKKTGMYFALSSAEPYNETEILVLGNMHCVSWRTRVTQPYNNFTKLKRFTKSSTKILSREFVFYSLWIISLLINWVTL